MTESDNGVSLEKYFLGRLRMMVDLKKNGIDDLDSRHQRLLLRAMASTYKDLRALGKGAQATNIIIGEE